MTVCDTSSVGVNIKHDIFLLMRVVCVVCVALRTWPLHTTRYFVPGELPLPWGRRITK